MKCFCADIGESCDVCTPENVECPGCGGDDAYDGDYDSYGRTDEPCPVCSPPENVETSCFLCEGSGRIHRGEDDHRPIKCPDCGGTGRTPDNVETSNE